MTPSTLSRSAKWTFSKTFTLILLKIPLFSTITVYTSCSHLQHRARWKKICTIVWTGLRLPAKWNADWSQQTNDEQTGTQLMKLLTGSWTTIKADKTKQGVRESDKHSVCNEDTTFVRISSANLTIIPQEMNLQYAVYVILLLAT